MKLPVVSLSCITLVVVGKQLLSDAGNRYSVDQQLQSRGYIRYHGQNLGRYDRLHSIVFISETHEFFLRVRILLEKNETATFPRARPAPISNVGVC